MKYIVRFASKIINETNQLVNITSTSEYSFSSFSNNYSCGSFKNDTGVIIKDFDGVPENILINIGAWALIIIIFTFVRKIGKYGRFGVFNKERATSNLEGIDRYNIQKKYSDFKRPDSRISNETITSKVKQKRKTLFDNIFSNLPGRGEKEDKTNRETDNNGRTLSIMSQDFPHADQYEEKKWYSWIINLYRLT
jgi:hypothetical protein